jgi:deoxyadenosine/deoxycytidine kinase
MSETRHIVIDGPIGVGKTSLAQLLAERLNARLVLEQAGENPFLEDFYKNPKRFAFQTQVFFLFSRFQQQKELAQPELFTRSTVCDYLFAKDRIFAYLNLSEDEITLYDKIYELLAASAIRPDLVVYLVANPKILMKRIRRRARTYERRITQEYLEELVSAYNGFFFNYDDSPLLVVNTSQIDFVHSDEDFENLVNEILSHRRGMKHFIPIGSASQ